MADQNKKVSTESYKGVRDFYPPDQFIQSYIFDVWRMTVEAFGYEEYSASLLEPSELYRGKTSEEIVNEQTYTFTDRGDREVTLRPEMTPSVARMIAQKKRELVFPQRLFSVPNVFRYERPQKGRLREHWQLNVDLFGVDRIEAEVELLSIAVAVMDNFGVDRSKYEIRINDRALLEEILTGRLKDKGDLPQALRLLDRSEKEPGALKKLNELFDGPNGVSVSKNEKIDLLLKDLNDLGINNAVFSPTLTRGFDYYTGIVFEVFATDTDNNRSLFGGGRYDNLMEIFGQEKISAVGFGMGDVTIRDLLETEGLIPDYAHPAELYICSLSEEFILPAMKLAQELRNSGISVEVNMADKKLGDQISLAAKKKIPHVLCIGEDELKEERYALKDIETGKEKTLTKEGLISEFLDPNDNIAV